jgi:hypothetical protein
LPKPASFKAERNVVRARLNSDSVPLYDRSMMVAISGTLNPT